MKKEIILASGSPRRRELLNQIGIDFTVITSDADEITDVYKRQVYERYQSRWNKPEC